MGIDRSSGSISRFLTQRGIFVTPTGGGTGGAGTVQIDEITETVFDTSTGEVIDINTTDTNQTISGDKTYNGTVDFTNATVEGIGGIDVVTSFPSTPSDEDVVILESDLIGPPAFNAGLYRYDSSTTTWIPVGDVTLEGDNTFEGDNVFTGVVDFTGADIVGAGAQTIPVNTVVQIAGETRDLWQDTVGNVWLRSGVHSNEFGAYPDAYRGLAEFTQAYQSEALDDSPNRVVFSTDGLFMFATGNNTTTYSLSTAFDVTDITEVRTTNHAGRLIFNPEGTKLWVDLQDQGNNRTVTLVEYSLSTPWDLSTAVDSGNNIRVNEGSSFIKEENGVLYFLGITVQGYSISDPDGDPIGGQFELYSVASSRSSSSVVAPTISTKFFFATEFWSFTETGEDIIPEIFVSAGGEIYAKMFRLTEFPAAFIPARFGNLQNTTQGSGVPDVTGIHFEEFLPGYDFSDIGDHFWANEQYLSNFNPNGDVVTVYNITDGIGISFIDSGQSQTYLKLNAGAEGVTGISSATWASANIGSAGGTATLNITGGQGNIVDVSLINISPENWVQESNLSATEVILDGNGEGTVEVTIPQSFSPDPRVFALRLNSGGKVFNSDVFTQFAEERIDSVVLEFETITSGNQEVLDVTVNGTPNLPFNFSLVEVTPTGWITSGALAASSGTTNDNGDGTGTFTTTITVPAVPEDDTLTRTFKLRATWTQDPLVQATSSVFTQAYVQSTPAGNLSGGLTFSYNDSQKRVDANASFSTGNTPYTLAYGYVDDGTAVSLFTSAEVATAASALASQGIPVGIGNLELVWLTEAGTASLTAGNGAFTGASKTITPTFGGDYTFQATLGDADGDVVIIEEPFTVSDSLPTGTAALTSGVNSPAIGDELTLSASFADVDGDTLTYQWQRDNGSGFQDLPGATGTSYTFDITAEPSTTYDLTQRVVFPQSRIDNNNPQWAGGEKGSSGGTGGVPYYSGDDFVVNQVVVEGNDINGGRLQWQGDGGGSIVIFPAGASHSFATSDTLEYSDNVGFGSINDGWTGDGEANGDFTISDLPSGFAQFTASQFGPDAAQFRGWNSSRVEVFTTKPPPRTPSNTVEPTLLGDYRVAVTAATGDTTTVFSNEITIT